MGQTSLSAFLRAVYPDVVITAAMLAAGVAVGQADGMTSAISQHPTELKPISFNRATVSAEGIKPACSRQDQRLRLLTKRASVCPDTQQTFAFNLGDDGKGASPWIVFEQAENADQYGLLNEYSNRNRNKEEPYATRSEVYDSPPSSKKGGSKPLT